ncbi:MAG: adenosylcobinamide-GDP ribazoletransferase [Clostridium butyricum]|nr:adenosylcobinamide-GDP ribazoletransferase [Clostridium butyricum]
MKKYYKSFIMALSMFTIIPTPYIEWDDEGVKNMMKFYPLVGLIVGSIWSVIYYFVTLFNCSLILKSVVIMMVPFVITGMLHLDGFMDVCDAILSRRDRNEKLRILKDSTIGAFAVVSLVMLFFMQFGAVYSIVSKNMPVYVFMIIPVVSRTLVCFFLVSIVTIKESSLGTYFKKGTGLSDKVLMGIIFVLCSIVSFFIFGYEGLVSILFISIGVSVSVYKCIKEFGGISGDVSGFSLILGELLGLIGFCIL